MRYGVEEEVRCPCHIPRRTPAWGRRPTASAALPLPAAADTWRLICLPLSRARGKMRRAVAAGEWPLGQGVHRKRRSQ
jgi:hypothetical protein